MGTKRKEREMSLPGGEDFDGETFEKPKDGKRLRSQLETVHAIMKSGRWYSLRLLENITGYSSASISARIRDLRKAKFGGATVERARIDGTFQYRLKEKETQCG